MIDLSDNKFVEERYDKNFAYYRDYSDKIESDRKIEENTAKEYKGREILEFLQNAADAAKNREGHVRISLSGNQLIIENSGNPFNIDGVRSLFSANFSIKRVKKSEEFIGYKGLGFRSILNFSKDVKIFSEKLSIGYNLDNVREFQSKLIELQPEIIDLLDLEEDEIFLPFFCAPKILNEYPELSDGMCTKIVAKVESKYVDDVKKQIKKIGESELIFNNSLGNIAVDLENENYEINLELLNERQLANNTIVQEVQIKNTLENKNKKFSVYSKRGGITLFNESKNKDEERKYIVGVAFAENPVDISNKKLISYFSTDINNPFPFMINATFELTADRNRLYKNNPFNIALLDKLNQFIFDVVKEQYINVSNPNYDILKQLMFFDNKFLTDEDEGYNFGELFNHNLITNEIIPTKNKYCSLNQGLVKLNHDFYSIISKYPNYDDLIVFSNDIEVEKFLRSRTEIKNITSDQLTERLNDTIQNTNISREEILELSVLYFKELGLDSEGKVIENLISPRFFVNNDNEYIESSFKKYIVLKLKGDYQKICKIIGVTLVNEEELSLIAKMCKKHVVNRDNYNKFYSLEKLSYKDFASFVATKLDEKDINIRLYSSILKYFKENYTYDELSAARKSFLKDRNNENKDFYLLFPIVINNEVYKNFVCFNISLDYDILYYKFLNSLRLNGKDLPIHYFDFNDDYEFYNSIGVVQLDQYVNEILDTIKRMNINTIDIVKESNKFLAVTNQSIYPLNNWKIISEGEIKSANVVYRYDRIVSDEIYEKLNVSFCDYKETFGKYSNEGKEILDNKLNALSISELFERACNNNYIDVMYKIFEDYKQELPRTFSSNEVKLYSGVAKYIPSELFFDNNTYGLVLPKLPDIKILSLSRYSEYGCSKEFFEYLGVKEITVNVVESNICNSTDKIVLPFLYFSIKNKLVVDDLKHIFGDYKYYSKNENIEEAYLKKMHVGYLKYSDIYKKIADNGCDKKLLDEYLEDYIGKIGYKLIDEDCVITELIDTVNDINKIKKCNIDIYKIMYNDFYLKGKIPVDKIKKMYLPTIDGEYVSNSENLYYMVNDELLDDLKGKNLHIIHLDFVENNKFYYDLRIQQLARDNLKDMIEKTNDKIKLPFLFYIEYDEMILKENEIKDTFGRAKYINKDEIELSNVLTRIGVDFIDYYTIKKLFEGKFKNPEIVEKYLSMYLTSCGYKFITDKRVNREIIDKIKNLDNEINDFSHKYYYEHIFMNSKSVNDDVNSFRINTNNGYKLKSEKIVYIPDIEWNKWIPDSLTNLNIEKLGFVATKDYYAKIGVKEASKDNYVYIINEEYKVIQNDRLNDFTNFVLKQSIIDDIALAKIDFCFNIENEKCHTKCQCNKVVYTNDLLEQCVYNKIGQPWISKEYFEKIANKEKIKIIEKFVKFKQIEEPEFFGMFLEALKNGLKIEQKELIKQLKKFHSNKDNAFEEKISNSNLLPSVDYYAFDEYMVNLLKEVNPSICVLLITTEEEKLFKVLGKNKLPNYVFYSEIAKSLASDKCEINHDEKINILYECFKKEPENFKYAVEQCNKTINLMVNNKTELIKSSHVYFGNDYDNPLLEKVLFDPFNNFLSSRYLQVIDDNIVNIKTFFMAFMVTNKIKRHSVNYRAKKLYQYDFFKENIQISKNAEIRIDTIESFDSTMDNATLDDFLEYIDANHDSIFAISNIYYYEYYEINKIETKKLIKSINQIQLLEEDWVKIDEEYYTPSNCTIISKYDLSPIYKYSLELDKYRDKSWFSKLNVLTKLDNLNILDFYEILRQWKNDDTKKTLEFYSEMCKIYDNKDIDFTRKDIQKSKERLKSSVKLLGCKNNEYGYYNYEDLVIVDRTITNHYLNEVPQFLPDYKGKWHLKRMFDIKYISEVNVEEALCIKSTSADLILDFLTKKLNCFSFLFKDEDFSSKINICFLQTGEFYINGSLVRLNNYEYLIDLKKSIIYFNLSDEILDVNSLFENQNLLKIIVDAFANLSGGTEAMTILTILLLDEAQVSTYFKMIKNKPIKKKIKFNLVNPQKRSLFSKIKYLFRR